MNKLLLSGIFAVAVGTALSSHAYVVNYLYDTPLDGSAKTSKLVGPANVPTGNVFVETFDAKNGGGNAQGCGLDTPAGLVDVSGGSFALRKGKLTDVAAPPAGDGTCFAYGPSQGGSLPDVVNLDYTNLLGSLGSGASLNYLGLYYGSIDKFNDLLFYGANDQLLGIITGASLIAQFSGQSGNQQADSSNIYVNLFFDPSEAFTSFSFRTTGIAFEMDNVVVGFNVAPPSQVPEPASIALLGMGLLAMGAVRRRRKYPATALL